MMDYVNVFSRSTGFHTLEMLTSQSQTLKGSWRWLVLISHPEEKCSHMISWLLLTCSLVSLDLFQPCESPEGPAFFEGHNRYHALLIVQPQL